MPGTAIWIGRVLILIGLIGYGYGIANGNASLTAMIPAAFGLVILVLGHLSAANEKLRKHLMHAAMLIGVIGFIVPLIRLVPKLGELTLSAAVVSQVAMSAACLIFVVLGVRSFIAARQS